MATKSQSHQRSLFDLRRNLSQEISQSRSPVRNLSGIKLYNFSKIDSYGKIQKPFLNDEKKQNIQWRL